MRLLSLLPSGDFTLTTFDDHEPPPYAILSHTWGEEEVIYQELVGGLGKEKFGYAKLGFCGERAAADSIRYFWVDTCCINKQDSAELDTAINSMFRWYQRAAKCYVYLPDVSVSEEVVDAEATRTTWIEAFRKSRWFTRGWTLQELVAPATLEFFSKERKRLGDKSSLEKDIHEVTRLPVEVLRGQSFAERSVDERMTWSDNRTTYMEEDIVYCLLGIFGVKLVLNYGEGAREAAERLREKIDEQLLGPRKRHVRPLLPFARNELFVGREDQLKSLEQSLLPNEPFETHRRRTIHGLGGCGKSALALEFAYRALVRLPQLRVFWVPALTQESFLHAYQEIAIRLSIPGIHVKDVDMKKLVVDALSAPSIGNWLMIVDNVDDSEVLFGTDNNLKSARFIDWLPHSNHGIILFTTRNRGVAEQLTPGLVLDMKEMTPSEARQMVTCRITKKELLDDDITINKLVRLLEHLPLAIVSATAFISNKEVTVTEYVSQFQETDWMTKLFSDHFVDSSRYVESDSTIARTWHISFEHIRKQDPLAAEYLSFMACIDRINIPRSVLPPGTWLQQTSALGTLKSYAFITEQQREKKGLDTERLFDMHRLVHMASVSWLDAHCERKTWAGTVSDRLIELIPRNGNERSEVWRNYLSHAIYVVDHEVEMEDALKAAILNRVGRCQSRLGQCAAAKMTFSRTLELRKKCLGKQDDRTLATMDELGVALSDLGQYPEAEDMHKQALVGRRERLGFDHPHTLGTMSNLASTLMEQHRFAEAESMYKDAIELQVKVCGSGHLDTLTSMSNLALVLSYQRKLEESESLNWVALEGKTKLLGREHPSTTATMGNLALVLNSQGKKAEALALTKEVHEHKEKALGRDHPQTLISVNNLISMLDSDQEAEPMLRDLLKRRSEVLGPRHPHTLAEMENLALCLDRQGKDEAEAVAREVLIMRQDVHGPDHLNTISSVWSLALILGHDYQFAESHKLFERAYAGLCAANGENDNTTRNCRHDWDKMLAEQAASRNMPEKLVARVARIRLGGWMPFARYND